MADTLVQTQLVDSTIKATKQNGTTKLWQPSGPIPCTLVLVPTGTNLKEKHFEPKTLELHTNTPVKIGRQTSSKTAPSPFNGFFDSKVLSRTHAETWCDKGKVYIKDVKSSNGTFLNGERLSPENEESKDAELHDGDNLEFGIDITNDDGSVLYRKVACTVMVFASALSQVDGDIIRKLQADQSSAHGQFRPKSMASSVSSIATATNDSSASPLLNGKHSQNWETVLKKLQNELQRSQNMEAELRSAKKAVSELDKELDEERQKHTDSRHVLMQEQLREAQTRASAYAEKCRHQEKAMSSAHRELRRLQQLEEGPSSVLNRTRQQLQELRLAMDDEQLRLNKDLSVQKQKCIDYEAKCLALEQQIQKLKQRGTSVEGTGYTRLSDILQMRAVQVVIGLLMAIISALLYALIVI